MMGYASTATVVLLLLLCCDEVVKVNSQSQRVPALFVFGDSLVEVGNNNFLNSIAKANFFPYGIDYSRGNTGRFSNGKSFIDFVGILFNHSILVADLETNQFWSM